MRWSLKRIFLVTKRHSLSLPKYPPLVERLQRRAAKRTGKTGQRVGYAADHFDNQPYGSIAMVLLVHGRRNG